MTNSVSYKYVPNQSVYVINTLGPNGQWPYWGFPFPFGCGLNGSGFVGFPNTYPNGFTSTTPAIQSGVVLQVRILFTTSNPPVPTIMYDVRVTGEMGTTPFPESMVFPATAGVAGYQTVQYGTALTYNSVVNIPGGIGTIGSLFGGNSYTTGVYINVPLTGGAGTGALATVTVAGGAVTNVVITNAGANYHIGDILSANNTDIGGTGTGFAFAVATIVPAALQDTMYIDGAPVVLQLPAPSLSVPTPTTVSALLSILNNKYATQATFTLVSGNLVVTSAVTGETSSIVLVENAIPANSLLNTIAAGMVIQTAVPGVASGLDQAQAFYATLNL